MSTFANRLVFKKNLSFVRLFNRCINDKRTGKAEVTFSNGRKIQLSSGKLARMADGCAVAEFGDTSVMVTAVSKSKQASAASFVPLTVDYRQKAAAAGRIPTNYLRRELSQTEREVLISRVIDRSIRSSFPKGFSCDTQIVCNLLAVDGVHDSDVLAINGASAALALSDISWNGPIGAVRVGIIDDNVIINPTRHEQSLSSLNMIISANAEGNVVMLEAGNSEPVIESTLLKAFKKGVQECKHVIAAISELQNEIGKPKRELDNTMLPTEEHIEAIKALCSVRLQKVFMNYEHDKFSRDDALTAIRVDAMEKLIENFPHDDPAVLNEAYYAVVKNTYCETVFETNKRCDGRLSNELRPISCDVDLYKPLHGSALFQRGQTQVLCTVTFDSLDSAFRADNISVLTGGIKEKNFMLHYEFPPYATNDTGRSGAVGRREMGHGALAEKALRPVIPSDFPFTIRLTCEVLESNGSSSMASVCAGSLALMDAGVGISAATAGVAMGLITNGQRYEVLTDILGLEDYFGEMDFKIAGTRKGFTSLQLDCKLSEGLPFATALEAITKAGKAKAEILRIMNNKINQPRQRKKDNWPVTETIEIPIHKRSRFMGFGGSNLKKLTADIGVHFTEDEEDSNKFIIFAPNQTAMDEAKIAINHLLESDMSEPILEFGAIYPSKIVEIRDNGVMVQLFPNMRPAFIHVSQLDTRKVTHPSALDLDVDQEIQVKYFGRDPATGQMRLSRKALLATETFKRRLIETQEES